MTKLDRKVDSRQVKGWIEQLQQSPDQECIKEQFVLHYTPLIHSLARRYAYNELNQEDLAQVGMIGLINAAKRFDITYGTTFESFAIPTIIGEIKRYLRDQTWSVEVPRRVKELGPKIQHTIDKLTLTLQRSPTIKEVATVLNIPENEIIETMDMASNYKALSIDFKYNHTSEDHGFTLLDVVSEEETYFLDVERKMLLESILPILTERERKILTLLFYDRLTQQEVGEILNISQMHVSRIQKRALKKLRKKLERN